MKIPYLEIIDKNIQNAIIQEFKNHTPNAELICDEALKSSTIQSVSPAYSEMITDALLPTTVSLQTHSPVCLPSQQPTLMVDDGKSAYALVKPDISLLPNETTSIWHSIGTSAAHGFLRGTSNVIGNTLQSNYAKNIFYYGTVFTYNFLSYTYSTTQTSVEPQIFGMGTELMIPDNYSQNYFYPVNGLVYAGITTVGLATSNVILNKVGEGIESLGNTMEKNSSWISQKAGHIVKWGKVLPSLGIFAYHGYSEGFLGASAAIAAGAGSQVLVEQGAKIMMSCKKP